MAIITKKRGGRYLRNFSFFPTTSRTPATYNSDWIEVGDLDEFIIFVDVTAVEATATLDVSAIYSPDKTTEYVHSSLAQISAVGKYSLRILNFGRYLRVKAIVGTASVTFGSLGIGKG